MDALVPRVDNFDETREYYADLKRRAQVLIFPGITSIIADTNEQLRPEAIMPHRSD
ncbi:hypothetical protein D3C84_1119800 [compost metagenome]